MLNKPRFSSQIDVHQFDDADIEHGATHQKYPVLEIDSIPKSQLKFRNFGLDFVLIIFHRNHYKNLGHFSSMLSNQELDNL